jgi:hypothetical protein
MSPAGSSCEFTTIHELNMKQIEVEVANETKRATILLTVKASPEIGRSHGETVCVAGLRLDRGTPEWIRLFPVRWEWFFGGGHPKYQIIEIDIEKHHKDQRPESYRPLLETATVISELKGWPKRAATLNLVPQRTMCSLFRTKGWTRSSLGLVVPKEVTGFTATDNSQDTATQRKMVLAAQQQLIDPPPTLQFAPYTFRFEYRCYEPLCRGHAQTIVDWEISEAWRNWSAAYPTDFLERIEDKWMGLVAPEKQPAFFVGNQHQAPDGFLILGIANRITLQEPSDPDTAETEPIPPTKTTLDDLRLFD